MASYFWDSYRVVPEILSRLLNIPTTYFKFPDIIFYFIIPFIAATYFWYVILQYKIRIFRRSPVVNMAIAFFISFFNVTMVAVFPPYLSVPFFVSLSLLLAHGYWTGKRVLLSVLVFFFIWRIYPWLMGIIL